MSQEKTGVVEVSLKAINVMVKEVITIKEDALVKEAVDTMNRFEIGSIIAVKRGKATGIITERDLLKRIVAEGKNARRTRVRDIMSKPLLFITPDTQVEEAARFMFQKKIKKLPVIDRNRLVGIVSLTDIARSQSMLKFLQKLAELQSPSKNIKKVLDYYIV
jgi:CBS domain-containing protein